jgi:beta-RFAP synthase
LHFGLFHVPVDGLTHDRDGRPIRKFGGLGMMIEKPCVTVTATEAGAFQTSGPLAGRAEHFLHLIRQSEQIQNWRIEGEGQTLRLHIQVDGPPEHIGLGVGTSVGLAIVAAVRRDLYPFRPVMRIYHGTVRRMAEAVNRGERSAIGMYGFERGGFIVDGGKEPHERFSRLESRIEFPADWRVLLVRPPGIAAWFGGAERGAFARNRPHQQALFITKQLHIIARSRVIRALQDADFDTFAQSIFEFNRLAGEPFHDDQGGPYAGVEVACVIDELMEMGAVGVGQSSWGPTVFAMCRDVDEAEHLAAKARARFSSATEVTVTAGNNTGARIETV